MKRTLSALRLLQLLTLLSLTVACPKRNPEVVVPVQKREHEPHRVETAPAPSDPRRPRDDEAESRVRETLAAVDRVLGTLVDRTMTERERDDREAAAAFVVQALDALHEEDLVRASVLAEKARLLVDSLAKATEP